MSIHFTCPHCGVKTEVSEEFVGRSVPCVQCQKPITIPLPADAGPGGASPRRNVLVPPLLVIIVLVLSGMLIYGVLKGMQPAQEANRRAGCLNNLKQIGLAMQDYHSANGSFPPAYVSDKDGEPMHSWRVLLLPYMRQKALDDAFDFDQPWDSPHNLALAGAMPDVYQCPSASPITGGPFTNYVMVVGPEAAKLEQVRDGASRTIIVVEVAGARINWLDTKDVTMEELARQIAAADTGPEGNHPGVVNVLYRDGSVHSISRQALPQLLRAMSPIGIDEDASQLPVDF